MSKEFGFQKSDLGKLSMIKGLFDTLRQVGTFMSLISILLFPIKYPKKMFFIFSCIKCLVLLLLISGKLFEDGKIEIYCFYMIILGWTNGVAFVPNLMVCKPFLY